MCIATWSSPSARSERPVDSGRLALPDGVARADEGDGTVDGADDGVAGAADRADRHRCGAGGPTPSGLGERAPRSSWRRNASSLLERSKAGDGRVDHRVERHVDSGWGAGGGSSGPTL